MKNINRKILSAGLVLAITLGLLSMVGCENEVKLDPIKDEPKKEQAGDKDSTAGTNGTKTEGTSSPAANNPGSAGNQELFVIRVEDASGQDISSSFDFLSLAIGSEEGGETVYNFTSNSGGSAFQQMKSIIETVVSPGTWNFTLKASKSGQLLATSTQQAQVDSRGNTIVFKMNYEVASDTSQSGGGNSNSSSPSIPDNNGSQEPVVFDSPISYDARTENLVTPVKEQVGGTCWAYAAASAIETAMIKNKLATKDTVDLSEAFLVYYGYNTEPAPIGGMEADRWVNSRGYSIVNDGGAPSDLINTLCAWVGVVDQNKFVPYIYENNITEIDNYRKDAYKNQAAYVTSAGTILANVGEENMAVAIKGMKEAILAYGSIATAYNVSYNSPSYYNDKTYGRYYDGISPGTNHAITIVGWDDTFNGFSKNPPTPGAWLVKNSYGEDWNYGDKGYFWLSYYDTTIALRAVYFDVTATSEYDNNYQYDGARVGDEIIHSIGPANIIESANIYTTENPLEELKAVQFTIVYNNLSYKIEVYKGVDENNPTSGIKVSEMTGGPLPMGKHTVKLDTPVRLQKDEKFSVVVTYSSSSSIQSSAIEYESIKNSEAGQSFYRTGGSSVWKDMHTEGLGNLRLKAFTKNVD